MRPKLRLASYNIQKAVGVDFRRDPARIIVVINGLEADVVALQEVDKRLGERPSALCRQMIETETDFQIAPLARTEVSLGWHGNAILVRRDHAILASGHIELPGLEPRGAVRVDVGTSHGPVALVGAHLALMRHFRRLQLRTIHGHLDDAPVRTVIMGDFNEWSVDRGFEPLEQDYTIISPGNSFHAARPVAGLDRFALGHDVHLCDAGVEQGVLASRSSDHLPVWADVKLAPAPPGMPVLPTYESSAIPAAGTREWWDTFRKV